MKAFEATLARKGLLNEKTGSLIVKGIPGEDGLLARWEAVAGNFINKNRRLIVGMRVERLYHGESRCTPVVHWA